MQSLDDRTERAPQRFVGAVFGHALEELPHTGRRIGPATEDEQRAPAVRQPPFAGADALDALTHLIESAEKADDESAALSRREYRAGGGSPDEERRHPLRAPREQRVVPVPATADIEG